MLPIHRQVTETSVITGGKFSVATQLIFQSMTAFHKPVYNM